MSSTPPKRENLLLNLACNLAAPTFVFMKLSGDNRLGPLWGGLVALAFPLGYGVYDFVRRRKTNFISLIGIASILLAGGLLIGHAGGFWFAVKDGALPLLIGAAVLASLRSKSPLIRELFYNEQIIDVARVDAILTERGTQAAFERLLARTSLWLGAAFVISAVLNFCLARHLLKSPANTPEFNAELGRMHVLSWPVIVVPSMAVMMIVFWRLIAGLKNLTGLTADEIFRAEEPKK
ncbi:MAG TPA: VC0807 family protein [Opitutaceae bacterium]|nr:VC0807 family protein [Opitutaceae bacterium]